MRAAKRGTKTVLMNKMELLLPPSVNALHINSKGSYRRILTQEGRWYIYTYAMKVKADLKKAGHTPIDEYFHLDLDWFLPRRNCDSHNYVKGLMDMLEKAGLMTNDRYVMPRTQSVQLDTKNPRVIIQW